MVWKTFDGFGNGALAGSIDAPHDRFRFEIRGTAEISEESFINCGGPERILLYHSALTRPHIGLVDFYNEQAKSAPEDKLKRIEHFSHAVHEYLHYERGITNNATTAGEAFDTGAGVCQDYAHILLSLLRLDGTYCRYVAGMASDYGETHAWVEAWVDGRYYGIDPTRDKWIDEGYIAISRGRDFEDCSIERGMFKCACRGTQTITLTMEVL
jgi:hypothetical protein